MSVICLKMSQETEYAELSDVHRALNLCQYSYVLKSYTVFLNIMSRRTFTKILIEIHCPNVYSWFSHLECVAASPSKIH